MPERDNVHGSNGVFYGGAWVDVEDLGRAWNPATPCSGETRLKQSAPATAGYDCDVAIIGAGCVGAAIARELSKSNVHVVLVEQSDDVTQGATKGNSGIVHAGFDDTPGSVRAELCWKGNQMFTQLDAELRFGLQRNGSLVVARCAEDDATLRELLARGKTNGVRNLRIISAKELRKMEPSIADDATGALFSPDAGTLTPYEYTIALAENAVDNGVDLRLRTSVVALERDERGKGLVVHTRSTPSAVARARAIRARTTAVAMFATCGALLGAAYAMPALVGRLAPSIDAALASRVVLSVAAVVASAASFIFWNAPKKTTDAREDTIRARFVINAAGNGSGDIAKLAGDTSFYIKPRIGEYLLMHKKEGSKARHILFPAPGKMGKGVLVQTTLWGNLILGPTAADLADPTTPSRSRESIMSAILSKCRELVPSFDASAIIHTFSGLRAKSSAGDWIIRRSAVEPDLVHAAGIDSPGLAGSPAIAERVVGILRDAGLPLVPRPGFNPNRRPIIVPKDHVLRTACVTRNGRVTSVKMKLPKEGESPPSDASAHIVCKCELVTEAEIVDAAHRSLPCENTQAVRKRTRAGMGHCQGEYCESRVRAILSREHGVPVEVVEGRPWPASSILPNRWLTDAQKRDIAALS
jgi:glycerol-3-phosphate dehydrogenase